MLIPSSDAFLAMESDSQAFLVNNSEDMMYPLIECLDIDRFIFEVWNWFPSDSELEEEINLKYARKRLIGVMKRISV